MDELLVFDLDGTLLNEHETLAPVTRFALAELDKRGVNWTIATGRMPHGAQEALPNIRFKHPQVYKNGVLVWDLTEDVAITKLPLDRSDAMAVCERLAQHQIKPWLNTIDHNNQIAAIVEKLVSERDQQWVEKMALSGIYVQEMPDFSDVSDDVLNIFAATTNPAVLDMAEALADLEDVAVYAGHDMYTPNGYWLDIHHAEGTKGDAVKLIKKQLGAKRLICFGDSDNDYSMFQIADECYAMGQGLQPLKDMATATIGRHNEHGIAEFLAQRYGFSLP